MIARTADATFLCACVPPLKKELMRVISSPTRGAPGNQEFDCKGEGCFRLFQYTHPSVRTPNFVPALRPPPLKGEAYSIRNHFLRSHKRASEDHCPPGCSIRGRLFKAAADFLRNPAAPHNLPFGTPVHAPNLRSDGQSAESLQIPAQRRSYPLLHRCPQCSTRPH